MNLNFFNYEYFWCDNNHLFKTKNIILKHKHTDLSSLPIIEHENEPNHFDSPQPTQLRTFFLHPELIIKSPISNLDNHFYILCSSYLDRTKNQLFLGEGEIMKMENELPFEIYFSIRQKVKCQLTDKMNSFYLQKLIDEIIFVLKKVEIPLTEIYFSEDINHLIYFLHIEKPDNIIKIDLLTKFLISKILLKYNIYPEFIPQNKSIKNTHYLWSIQFPIFKPEFFNKIKENLINLFKNNDGCLIQKENKPINQLPTDFITIKTNYQIYNIQNIFNNLPTIQTETNLT